MRMEPQTERERGKKQKKEMAHHKNRLGQPGWHEKAQKCKTSLRIGECIVIRQAFFPFQKWSLSETTDYRKKPKKKSKRKQKIKKKHDL